MERKRHTAEEIVSKLRQVDVLMAQRKPVADAVREIAVTEVNITAGPNQVELFRVPSVEAVRL